MDVLMRAKRPKGSKVRKENGSTKLIGKHPVVVMMESMAMEDQEMVLEVEGLWKRIQSEQGMYGDDQRRLAEVKKESCKKKKVKPKLIR